jgi:hypothetical protein
MAQDLAKGASRSRYPVDPACVKDARGLFHCASRWKRLRVWMAGSARSGAAFFSLQAYGTTYSVAESARPFLRAHRPAMSPHRVSPPVCTRHCRDPCGDRRRPLTEQQAIHTRVVLGRTLNCPRWPWAGLSKKCPWVRFGRSVPTPRASQPARPPTLQGSFRGNPIDDGFLQAAC